MSQSPAGRPGLGFSTPAYLVALGLYVLLGLVFKSAVLNWVVGPLFPLAVLYLLPNLLRRKGIRPGTPP